jgi:hydroxymethylpyrimidine/phosphomethylpyrimidine kinase
MIVAAIGTTHPWNIAGIGLDLAHGRERGVRVVTALAAVSVQDARGVHAVEPVSPAVLAAQIAAFADLPIRAFRIGLLPTVAAVRAVAHGLARYPGVPVVCDPIFAATVGGVLVREDTRAAFVAELVPRCTLVTPNLAEAGQLCGFPVTTRAEMERAGAYLVRAGAAATLVKGGHLDGDPIDVLVAAAPPEEPLVHVFGGGRLPETIRGTGDLLAFGIACELAYGARLVDAVDRARGAVRMAITRGVLLGGMRVAD